MAVESSPRLSRFLLGTLLITGLGAFATGGSGTNLPLPTTVTDFAMPGTQENTLNHSLVPGETCTMCHANFNPLTEPFEPWAASMMGQATRDPVFHAALAIANQDASFAGDLCLRCHTPAGWLHGKSVPTDGSNLDVFNGDMDGVGCHFCHRMVDPIYDAAQNPSEDAGILANLSTVPTDPHSGQYIVDPEDRRRGPFDLGGFSSHEWRISPFHRESMLCGTCHDVSNPAFNKQADGSYKLNPTDQEHPTHQKQDEFPVERTFSEWSMSQFAQEDIEMGGRFGGNKTAVGTCQDCHMPDTSGRACPPGLGGQFRDDLPQHFFNGGNTWVLRAVNMLYPDWQTGLKPQSIDDSINRAKDMLLRASDMFAFERGGELVVRVVNHSAHKLPTGYPEGRRMWLNVVFKGSQGETISELGAYDLQTADLTTGDTTVFEAELGLDAYMAGVTGLPAGVSFHFALNNTVIKDNRIPPRGFTNNGFELVQSLPVGQAYLDEQYWHDSEFTIPPGAESVAVKLWYQTTSKEYIEFLRDENTTNDAGDLAHRVWEFFGKSAPALMDDATLALASPGCPPPIEYGLAIPTSSGAKLHLGSSGTPSVAAANFALDIAGGPAGALGLVFVGTEPASMPLPFGRKLVGGATTRLPVFQLDGLGTRQIPIAITPGLVDQERYYQVVVRDPLGLGGATSNGLHVDYCD